MFVIYDTRKEKNRFWFPIFLSLVFIFFLIASKYVFIPEAGFGPISTTFLAGIVGMYVLNVSSDGFPGMYKTYIGVSIVLTFIYAAYFSTYFCIFGLVGGMGVFSAISLTSDYYFPRT